MTGQTIRDRWPKGLVRHLMLDPEQPADEALLMRVQHDGGASAGGSDEIHYTLVLHPSQEDRAEAMRASAERDYRIGGPFSPERDVPHSYQGRCTNVR